MSGVFRAGIILVVLVCLALASIAAAETLPYAKPEEVGLPSERLGHVTEILRNKIVAGEIPGALLLIARHGKIAYFESLGLLDPQAKTPMHKDAIFRIYSMSKPITTVAVMMLFEDGLLALSEPVGKYLPALAKMQVTTDNKPEPEADPHIAVVPADRPISIQDSDAPYLWVDLRVLRRYARKKTLRRGRPGQLDWNQCRIRRAHRQAATLRALLGAVDQAEAISAIAGSDRDNWRDDVGLFGTGSPFATDVGIEVLHSPRDYVAVKRALAEAGYKGEKIIVMAPTDVRELGDLMRTGAKQLRRAGMNVDMLEIDFANVDSPPAERRETLPRFEGLKVR